MSSGNLKISAVIVTYYPDPLKLSDLICALRPQVTGIVIVDNGSSPEAVKIIQNLVDQHSIDLILQDKNVGIAAAQNIGISHLKLLGTKYVVIFDHDSKPSENMVEVLFSAMREKESAGIKVGAIGPRYFDHRQSNPPPFIEIKGCRVVRHSCKDGAVVPVSYVIASGSLMSMETLNRVGGMREDLFIDYVDIEWGLRAANKGYLSFGACSALMEHDLGDLPIKFMGKSIPLHSPLRHYYLFRNAVWLYRQDYLPFQWKIGDAWRLLLKYGFYSLYGKPRVAHFKMMSKGVWHGCIGRVGQLHQ